MIVTVVVLNLVLFPSFETLDSERGSKVEAELRKSCNKANQKEPGTISSAAIVEQGSSEEGRRDQTTWLARHS